MEDVGIAQIGTSNSKCLTNTTLTGVSAWALWFLPPVLATGVVLRYLWYYEYRTTGKTRTTEKSRFRTSSAAVPTLLISVLAPIKKNNNMLCLLRYLDSPLAALGDGNRRKYSVMSSEVASLIKIITPEVTC